MTSWSLPSALAAGLLLGCGSSESATGTAGNHDGDGGPASGGASPGAGGSAAGSSGGRSTGGAGAPSAGGSTGASGASGTTGSGGASGGQSSGGAASTGGGTGSGGGTGDVSCDPRKILCKRVAPECGTMEVPSVEGSCYGPCVAIGRCTCTSAEECPDSNQYTCNRSAAHCTPYLL